MANVWHVVILVRGAQNNDVVSATSGLCVRTMMELDQSCSVLREYGSEQTLLSRPDGSSTFVQGICVSFVTDLFLYSERLQSD